jgi:membrane-associated protease RseP (regulator of RpoE activity)
MVTIAPMALALAVWLAAPAAPPAPRAVPSPPAVPAVPDVPEPPEVLVVDDDDVVAAGGNGPVVVHAEHGRSRGFIGVRLLDLTPDLRAHFGAPREAGVMVAEVDAGSAAAKAGVAVGDIITAADGEKIEWAGELSRAVRRKKAGETVKLDVWRDRAARHLAVSVEERRIDHMDLGELGELGRLRELGPEIRTRVMREMEHVRPRIEMRRDRLERRLDQMQKRLDELEKKMSR